jgi:hypothetical protein
MKLNIEIDCTPEELQELFIPGEKQTEFLTKFVNSLSEQMQENVYKNYPDFMNDMLSTIQKNQEQFFKNFNKN